MPPTAPFFAVKTTKQSRLSESDGADVESYCENPPAPKKHRRCAKVLKQTRCVDDDSASNEEKEPSNQSDSDLNSTGLSDERYSEWEVSDFSSSEDSGDEWIP